jgi:glyoxylase-like metal-dependent hydrolase (beta-lactamase superfamily II)
VNYLLESFTAKVVATRLCAEWIGIPMNYFNKLYFDSDEMYSIKTVDLIAEEIDWTISWQGIDMHLIDAKGHTNRSMCLSVANALFSGDTMIYNTKPFLKKKYGASLDDLAKTLKKIYTNFDDKTRVFPGHGDFNYEVLK